MVVKKILGWLIEWLQPKKKSNLAKCIAIESGQFIFYLNEPALQEIQVARSQGEELQIPWTLVAQLRKLVLLDGEKLNRIQSGLTFCTYYVDWEESQRIGGGQGQLVFRTVLSADGDVINQVRGDYLQHIYCLEIVATHHWLINQLLSTLRKRTTQFINWLAWGSAFVVVWLPTLGTAIASWENSTPQAIASGFFAVILPWPAKTIVKRVLMFLSPHIMRAALRQMLSPNPLIRNTAQRIWQGLVG